jgi:hypothetical protein
VLSELLVYCSQRARDSRFGSVFYGTLNLHTGQVIAMRSTWGRMTHLAPKDHTLHVKVDSLLSLATKWGLDHLVQPNIVPMPRFAEIDSMIPLIDSIPAW